MPLSSIAVRRPVTTLMFTAGLVILGVVALTTLSVDFLPAIDIPKLTVQTSYPNTSPEEVEHAVTQPIESALGTVAGVKRIRSITREGTSTVTVEFTWGTAMDFALLEVREKLDQAGGSLPRGSDRPAILGVDPSAEPIMTVALASADRQPRNSIEVLRELKETARASVKRRIEQVEGVAQAAVLGGVEREIHVDVQPAALQSLGLTVGQIAEVLTSANMNLPGGTITYGLFRYSLRTLGEFQNCDDIRNTVIRLTDHGRPIRVRDCATVRDTHRERFGLTRYNGKEVILIQVRKEAGANTVEVSRSVRIVLDHLRSENPSLVLAVIADQAEFISQSIADVQQAILIGAVLAFVVLFYFLRQPRYPVIIGITMPVSILATLVAMYFLRINLNVISLTGLAFGIGMLGDNAIVLIENVTRLREQGMPLREATLEGAREIGTAVTASTLTNVAIFLPIVFVDGVAAQLFVDMGITMTISLMVSLVVAVTLVPMLVSRETSHMPGVRRLRIAAHGWTPLPAAMVARIDRFDDRVRAAVERYLAWALDHRVAVLLTTVGLLVLSILVASLIPAEPSPDIDQSRFVVQLRMPRGTSLEGVSAFSRSLEDRLRTTRGVKGVLARVGVTEEQSFWNADETSGEVSLLEVNAQDQGQLGPLMDSARVLLHHYSASTRGVEYAVKPYGTSLEQVLRPEPNDVSCRIAGRDVAEVERLARVYAEQMRTVPGLVDLRVSLQAGTPEYHITVDREAANRHGLSVHAVATHLAHSVRGNEATTLSDFDKKITIRVQPPAESRANIDALLGSSISVDGRVVPV
ncbi:MAG TPA: efflux RND transporter permease subunit, partial [Bacteroidota bacterium]|nr:efflux RND transporter permease subunit [Bacteroidota bacterium]